MTAVASRRILLFGIAVLCLSTPCKAADADTPTVQPLRFARGASSVRVNGAVVRGDRDLYSIAAQAGQRMTVRISAVEDNAVFRLYRPGAKARLDDQIVEVTGLALAGAAGGEDTKRWSGVLPQTGTYLIVVGGTRANATYELSVTVR